jgi:hypothetical protein
MFGVLVVDPATDSDQLDIVAAVHTYGRLRTIGGATGESRVTVAPGEAVRVRVVNTDNAPIDAQVVGAPYRCSNHYRYPPAAGPISASSPRPTAEPCASSSVPTMGPDGYMACRDGGSDQPACPPTSKADSGRLIRTFRDVCTADLVALTGSVRSRNVVSSRVDDVGGQRDTVGADPDAGAVYHRPASVRASAERTCADLAAASAQAGHLPALLSCRGNAVVQLRLDLGDLNVEVVEDPAG